MCIEGKDYLDIDEITRWFKMWVDSGPSDIGITTRNALWSNVDNE